ncbi:MAG: dUTPase [Clostridia bacterium]|nr:dUTPase [Clostridia bacterium]
MDKLDELFELQREFDSYLEKNRNISGLSLDDWVQKGVIALIAELIEVVNEVNYKWWKNPFEIDMDKLKEEMIDVLHFYISTCMKIGITPDEVLELYKAKTHENKLRQMGLSEKKGYSISEYNDKKGYEND